MKIKVKKEVTIVDLLALHYSKQIKTTTYVSNNGGSVSFKPNGLYDMEDVSHEDMFEVEYNEKVTEQTIIPRMIEIFENGRQPIITYAYQNESIEQAMKYYEKNLKREKQSFYMLNDDYSMKLLWKDGAMVK